ncbi:hypothetical protein ACIQU5_28075 [Streptomyces sp. NPDC090306]|uniref:hypothetical protein n=1 Tax=Streptomyces sp. NPDC090306 TaxID=3365961 RepID=UPI003802C683
MIAYVLLGGSIAGGGAITYAVAPWARGAHRLVVPRSHLIAELKSADRENDELSCKVVGLAREVDAKAAELGRARTELTQAAQRAANLENVLARRTEQAFELRKENRRLAADLANATAVRVGRPGGYPADDASTLPDEFQEFVNATDPAWRAAPTP